MKYRLMILGLLASSVAYAQPRLSMPSVQDFGTVSPESKRTEKASLNANLMLRNTGTSLLVISEVRPSCGCTAAPLDRDSLAPGDSTTMRLTFALPNTNGPISKTVTIRTNEAVDSIHVLTVKADVQRPIQLSASFFPFDKAVMGQPVNATVTLRSFTDQPITIGLKNMTEGLEAVTSLPVVIPPRGSQDLQVRYMPDRKGAFSVQATITTSIPGYEELPMGGYGYVEPSPEPAVVPAPPTTTPSTITVSPKKKAPKRK